MTPNLLPVSKMCKKLGVCPATAYAAISRGILDAKVVRFRRVKYVDRVCADPVDFQLWVRGIGDYRNRGGRMLDAFESGDDPQDIADRFGIRLASVWRALERRGIQKRGSYNRAGKVYGGPK